MGKRENKQNKNKQNKGLKSNKKLRTPGKFNNVKRKRLTKVKKRKGKKQRCGGGGFRLTHKDTETLFALVSEGQYVDIDFNPGLKAYRAIANFSANYLRYEINSLQLEFVPHVNNEFTGSLIIAPNYTPNDSFQALPEIQWMDATDAVVGKLNRRLVMHCSRQNLKIVNDKLLLRDVNQEDKSSYDYLSLNVKLLHAEPVADGTYLGAIKIKYDVTLYEEASYKHVDENAIVEYEGSMTTSPGVSVPWDESMAIESRTSKKHFEFSNDYCNMNNKFANQGEDKVYYVIKASQETPPGETVISHLSLHAKALTMDSSVVKAAFGGPDIRIHTFFGLGHTDNDIFGFIKDTGIKLFTASYSGIDSKLVTLAASVVQVGLEIYSKLISIQLSNQIRALTNALEDKTDAVLPYFNIGDILLHQGMKPKMKTNLELLLEEKELLQEKMTKIGLKTKSDVFHRKVGNLEVTAGRTKTFGDDEFTEFVLQAVKDTVELSKIRNDEKAERDRIRSIVKQFRITQHK